MTPDASAILRDLLAWYDAQKREFPFRGTRDPYRVWLAEMMLIQTRTETVVPYYERFLERFPDVFALARAPEEAVLKAWEGLGYYSRARNLHRAAKIVAGSMGGAFPDTAEQLRQLPGVGPYAAAAIASIAFGEPVPALDANLIRVIARAYFIQEDVSRPAVRKRLYDIGLALMPKARPGDMNQALMDLGATVCLPRPLCLACPIREECLAFASGDPARLPIQKPRKTPKVVPVAVVILTCAGRVMVVRRESALLRGLYTFLLNEGDASPDAARSLWPAVTRFTEVGAARHVFTHRVWEMRIYQAEAKECMPIKGSIWADAVELNALPMPAAMKAARKAAHEILMETGNP